MRILSLNVHFIDIPRFFLTLSGRNPCGEEFSFSYLDRHRAHGIVFFIQKNLYLPDILCFQECLSPSMARLLTKELEKLGYQGSFVSNFSYFRGKIMGSGL